MYCNILIVIFFSAFEIENGPIVEQLDGPFDHQQPYVTQLLPPGLAVNPGHNQGFRWPNNGHIQGSRLPSLSRINNRESRNLANSQLSNYYAQSAPSWINSVDQLNQKNRFSRPRGDQVLQTNENSGENYPTNQLSNRTVDNYSGSGYVTDIQKLINVPWSGTAQHTFNSLAPLDSSRGYYQREGENTFYRQVGQPYFAPYFTIPTKPNYLFEVENSKSPIISYSGSSDSATNTEKAGSKWQKWQENAQNPYNMIPGMFFPGIRG